MGSDGWYHTGDLAQIDENGYAKIVGRSKDMIIRLFWHVSHDFTFFSRGGENIYPAEVEALLLTHPDIIDAQVVGVPSRRLGEEVNFLTKFSKIVTYE